MDDEKEITMTNFDHGALSTWETLMGYSEREACKQVGCSRRAWRGWKAGTQKVPRYIPLAMAALAMGMTPFGSKEDENKENDDQ